MSLHTVILAAGQGTRMRSVYPKVLHALAGRPMLAHVIDTAEALHSDALHVVVGHGADLVREAFAQRRVHWVRQDRRLGTGHAVLQAMPDIPDAATVLVLYGDVPLVRPETLQPLVTAAGDGPALLTVELDDPAGYGRIIRDEAGRVVRIVEEKDATAEDQAVREVNTGLMAVGAGYLRRWLQACGNDNAQREYYLTDVVALARDEGRPISAIVAADSVEVTGINDRAQLARLERHYQAGIAEELMLEGTTLLDPARLDVRGNLQCGRDVRIDVNCIFEGEVVLEDGVSIGANCIIRDSRIGAGAVIESHSVLEDARIGASARVGPFARLRPGVILARGARLGNFVEAKKSRIGENSKINHLSYIGDTTVGRDVNVGAGTITCNYDGEHKHETVIGDGAFIGSDTQLVAPVSVGARALVGAGTTVTRDVDPDSLALSRTEQTVVPEWRKRRRPG